MSGAAESRDVTQLLRAWGDGEEAAFDRLVPLVYQDLRRLARAQLRRGSSWTLDTTGLVHEAYLRLAKSGQLALEDRGHFLAVAAHAMRQVVVEYARRRAAEKRGAGQRPVTLEEGAFSTDLQAEWLLALNQALDRLGRRRKRLVRVVECRYFSGLSIEETAEALDTSSRTVKREWTLARSWLQKELGADPPQT